MGAKICLCIMAKHEAQTIEKAVESCRPYVDHVLISIDSKSVDGTFDIARRIADTVIKHEFETNETPHGSFARIRNSYMDEAIEIGCDFVVHLDGHEYMKCLRKETLHSLIEKNPGVEAFYIDLEMNGIMIRQLRMSKLIPNIRYIGDIHNYLSGYKNDMYCDSVIFVHDRAGQPQEHVQERNKQRTMMSEEILSQKIKDNPNDSRSMFYLAQSYKETGQFNKAIDLFYRYLEVSEFPAEKWNARNYLYQCLRAVERDDEAYKVIDASLDEQPQRAEAWIILGDKAYNEKKFVKAIACYENATEIPRPSSVVFINESAYTWFSYDKLSMAFHNNEQYPEAIRAVGSALKGLPPESDVKRIGNNLVFWADQIKRIENENS